MPVGLMVVGSEMAGFTVVGIVLDLFVFGTMPWFTIGLTVFGCVAAFAHLLQMVKVQPTPPGSNRRADDGRSR